MSLCRLQKILIEVLFAKDRLDEIRRMGEVDYRLAFEYYLGQLTTDFKI